MLGNDAAPDKRLRAREAWQRSVELQIAQADDTYDPTVEHGLFGIPDLLDVITRLRIDAGGGLELEQNVEWLDSLVATGYESPYLHMKRAESLRLLDRFDEAEEAFRAALTIEARGDIALSYGDFLLRRGREQEAIAILRQLTEFETDMEEVEVRLAQADLELRSDATKALETIEAIVSDSRPPRSLQLTPEQFFRGQRHAGEGEARPVRPGPASRVCGSSTRSSGSCGRRSRSIARGLRRRTTRGSRSRTCCAGSVATTSSASSSRRCCSTRTRRASARCWDGFASSRGATRRPGRPTSRPPTC